MTATISLGELTLLQYLRDHSSGSGQRISLDPKPIKRDLRISTATLADDSAALVAHGFAGVRNTRPSADDVPSTTCSGIWVTTKGVEYLERLRKEQVKGR